MLNRVIIIGGGIGGLAIAHGFRKHGIPFHIYERDLSQNYRAQGYRIRVARDAVSSLHYLLDDETWRLFELTCGVTRLTPIVEIDAQTGRIDEPNTANDVALPPDSAKPYTVDRTLFRDLMLRDLDEKISYGKALTHFEESAEKGVTAFFEDGSFAHGALLIGADGAHSKVRQHYLPNHPIVPTGAVCMYGKTEITTEVTRLLEPILSRGMAALKDRSHNKYSVTVMEPLFFESRNEMEKEGFQCPPDYLYWVLSVQSDALGLDQYSHVGNEDAARLAKRISKNWHPSVKPILTHQLPGSTSVIPINSVDPESPEFTWTAKSRVTLIGDAVHIMGPTSGSGAIVTLRDAQTLCQLLVQDGLENLTATIEKYETTMRTYASDRVRVSWKMGDIIFAQNRDNDQHIGEVMMSNRQQKKP